MKSKMNKQKAGGKPKGLPNLSNKTRSKLLSRFKKEKFSKKKAKELADSITKEYGGLSVLAHQAPFLSEENNTRGGRRKKSLKKKSNKKKATKKRSNKLKKVRFQALNNPIKRRSY